MQSLERMKSQGSWWEPSGLAGECEEDPAPPPAAAPTPEAG
eukprot:gene25020-15655_t